MRPPVLGVPGRSAKSASTTPSGVRCPGFSRSGARACSIPPRLLHKPLYHPLMRLPHILPLIAVTLLSLVLGCSKSGPVQAGGDTNAATSEAANATAEKPLAATLAGHDPQLTNQLEQLAAKLEQSLLEEDLAAFKACFDQEAMLEEILLGVTASGKNFEAFKKGMRVGINKTLSSLAETWIGQETKYKGIVTSLNRPAIRFRFIGEEGGIAFIDFVSVRKRGGQYAVANIYNQSVGFDVAAQVRQTALPLLADLDKNLIQRILDKPQLKLSEVQQFGEFSKSFSQGDYDACIQQFPKLPEPLKNTLSARVIHFSALQKTGDMDGYRQALKLTAAQFKQTSFEFMLVDVYFLEKKYSQAIQCLDNFSKAIGPDSALLTLRACMVHADGQVAQAKESLSQALALEPECAFAHSRGIDLLLAAQDFKAVRNSMQILEAKAGYDFKGNLTDEVWKDFLKAPESAPWR